MVDWQLPKEIRELLMDTGYEHIRAMHGDPIPSNAVMTGLSTSINSAGSLFVAESGGVFLVKSSVTVVKSRILVRPGLI